MAEPGDQPISVRLQAGVYMCGLFSNSMSNLIAVVLPLWVISLNPTPFTIGLVLGSRQFLPLLLSIHGGAVVDQLGGRRVILIFGVILTAVTLLFPFATWVPALILIQMVTGLAATMSWIGTQTMIGQRMNSDPTYAGRLAFCTQVGVLLGPPLAGAAWDFGGAWMAFALLGVWGAGVLVGVSLIPKTEAEAQGVAPKLSLRDAIPRASSYIDAFRLMVIPAVLLVVIVSILRQAGHGVMVSFYVVYLESVGFSGIAIGTLLASFSVLGAVATLTAGPLSRWFNIFWLLVVAVGLSVILIAITPLLGASFVLLLLAMSLRGGSVGLLQALMMALIMKAAGPQAQGKAVGLRATANRLSMTFMPVIMGAVVQFAGLENAFLIIGAVLLVGLAGIAIYVRRTEGFRDV